MKTFFANAYGVDSAVDLLVKCPSPIFRAAREEWFENRKTLNIQIGQYHKLSSTSWIFQFIAPDTNSFDEIVPSFVTAVVNSGDNHRVFFFGSLDIVCPSLSGMYETRIVDDCSKIGFWVDSAQPSFDCWFTNPERTEMEIQTTLFLKPKAGQSNAPVKKFLKRFRIACASGGTDMWLP